MCPSYVPGILLGVETLICGISDAADVSNFQRVTETLFGLQKIICKKSTDLKNCTKELIFLVIWRRKNDFSFVSQSFCALTRRQPKPRCLPMICVQESFEPLWRPLSHHYFSFQQRPFLSRFISFLYLSPPLFSFFIPMTMTKTPQKSIPCNFCD